VTNIEKSPEIEISDEVSAFFGEVKKELSLLPEQIRCQFLDSFSRSPLAMFNKNMARCSDSALGASKYVVCFEFGGSAIEFIMATLRTNGINPNCLGKVHSDSLSV